MMILNIDQLQLPIMIFGGPYSNLEATQAIHDVATKNKLAPHNVICTGDIVAYCGSPEETTNLIRQWGCHVVMGNCEESVGFEKDDCGCGFDQGSLCETLSIDWYGHAVKTVSQKNKIWMKSLPHQINFAITGINFSVIHGGVKNISEFVFESSDRDKKIQDINLLRSDCVIGGHCGTPFGQNLNGKFWLNPGVIGMPANDGRQTTWYMLLDRQNDVLTASWHKLQFDNAGAIQKIKLAGLPPPYQDTLRTGLWPSMSVMPGAEQNKQGMDLNPGPIQIR